MKLKKILAAVAAAAVSVSAMAVNVFAADSYNAKLGFADTAWAVQDWDSFVEVTGDGQYTLESTAVAGASDFGVFVIDIEQMFAGAPEATAVLDKVEIDGSEISFDASKIIYGDIEEKGNYRIEIYNQYGDTKNDSPVNQATAIGSSMKVTFTVSGLGGGDTEAPAPAETEPAETAPAADNNTQSAATGNTSAAVMLSVMAVAGAAAAVSKKRK
ncbi:MAG: hypothetical protein K2N60_10105 [Oscillospiraceae bacterium]|nr:hypothetical protein [Oscillospiraceae bacterium]